MKDSQRESMVSTRPIKYIKANNERFSTDKKKKAAQA